MATPVLALSIPFLQSSPNDPTPAIIPEQKCWDLYPSISEELSFRGDQQTQLSSSMPATRRLSCALLNGCLNGSTTDTNVSFVEVSAINYSTTPHPSTPW